jgi:outer membrane protein assembly factor BamA
VLLAALAVFRPATALAVGESITDVRVLDNQRTTEDTIRSIAGVKIGDIMELDTLERVRERLNTAGLFSDVNVWWEAHGEGVRVNIAVKDKFPWAPVPTASWSANNRSFGLLFVHGNLFGRGKQMLFGGRLADVDSGAALAYRDPALFGSWAYWQLQGFVQRQVIPEYQDSKETLVPVGPLRETSFTSFGFEATLGIAWLRRVRTQIAWQMQEVGAPTAVIPGTDGAAAVPTLPATTGAVVGIGKANLSFDFRAREFAVMTGTAVSAGVDLASPSFGSDFEYWRVGAGLEHGSKLFKSHNFIYGGGLTFGHNLPFWNENTAGGSNLRGYLFQQFRGDTQISLKVEYHFPLFSVSSLDFRALVFYDGQAIWFRDLPSTVVTYTDPNNPANTRMYLQRDTRDARSFDLTSQAGFSASRDIHNAVGGGLRFFLRSVAVPLVGFDAGYGIEARHWQFFIVIGA